MQHQQCNQFIETGTLPLSVVPVKITNVVTPYIMRFYEVKDYTRKLNEIHRKLTQVVKKGILNAQNNAVKPQIGNLVIVHSKQYIDIHQDENMPVWQSRGIVGQFNPKNNKYNVQLVDYGLVIQLYEDEFTVISNDVIPDPQLTSFVGLYNIVPSITKKKDYSEDTEVLILDKWNESAIEFTRNMIAASSTIYFDHVATDQMGRQYGEFYLNIDNEIVVLSKSLVINEYATYLEEGLLQELQNPNCNIEKSVTDNNNIIYTMTTEEIILDSSESDLCQVDSILSSDAAPNYTKGQRLLERYSRRKKDTNKLNNDDLQKVLVYTSIQCESLEAVADAQFSPKIHKAWESFTHSARPLRIQSYMWPAIKKDLNVVAISSAHSGKTFGYTVAIAAAIAAQGIYPIGQKPLALILCSASSEVFVIRALCAEFLQHYNIRTVGLCSGKSEKSLVADLYNGCQILISTPCFLSRFLKNNKKLLSFEALRHLILDNADIILDKYKNALGELIRHGILTNRDSEHNKMQTLQIIAASRQWTTELKEFVRVVMEQPYICIGSFLEAAAFKSVKPTMYIVPSEEKHKKILDLLAEKTMLKTVIICTCMKEAVDLNTALCDNRKTVLAHEGMKFLELEGVKECWKSYTPGFCPLLICTDEVLPDINITDADWLIHFSIALNWKSEFNYRFSTLMDNLLKDQVNCKVSVIADENNNLQFVSIMKIMQRFGAIIPSKLLQAAEHIALTLDRGKKSYAICDSVKAFGNCQKSSTCYYRHSVLADVDTPTTDIQKGDKVKLLIMYIHNATHFSARIIECRKSETLETKTYSSSIYMQLSTKMQQFYSNPKNRRTCDTYNVGSIYAIEEPIGSFKRVQILHIKMDKLDCYGKPKYVDIRCIDSGITFQGINIFRLWELPEDILKLSNFTVEVFLSGIAPYDDEPHWNRCANEATNRWFKQNFSEGMYVQATVCLHLANTIWTNDLKMGTKLIGYNDIITTSLRSELIENHHAVENDKHMSILYGLCKTSGLF